MTLTPGMFRQALARISSVWGRRIRVFPERPNCLNIFAISRVLGWGRLRPSTSLSPPSLSFKFKADLRAPFLTFFGALIS